MGTYFLLTASISTGHETKMQNNICSISPDGKYFFYTYEGDIYWVSIQVIKRHKQSK